MDLVENIANDDKKTIFIPYTNRNVSAQKMFELKTTKITFFYEHHLRVELKKKKTNKQTNKQKHEKKGLMISFYQIWIEDALTLLKENIII